MNRNERLKDIKDHPERHRHSFGALQACCFVDGALDMRLMDAHSGAIGRVNGSIRCDVNDGPCACGAWH